MFKNQSNNLWIKASQSENEKGNKSSFKEDLYVFLNSTICHCYRHLAQIDRTNIERFMWFCIHIFDACALIFFTFTIWNDFTLNPLVTTLHDTIYPIGNIPFPAVTICSNNRISRRQAEDFARELALKGESGGNISTKRYEEFLNDLEFIGRIYDYEIESEHAMTSFQQILDQTINDTNTYNFSSIVHRLTPKCEDILIKCFFKGAVLPCMMRFEMMETRRCSSGFCCSFNFMTMGSEDPRNYPYHNDVTGPDMGLILIVRGLVDDYFYNAYNLKGFHVMIHNSKEYPDPGSGTAIQKFVAPGQEAFLRVDASSIASERDILGYSAEKRQCLFPHEKKAFNGKYTRGECLLTCKIRSVKALCDCIPFQLPPPPGYAQAKICTLEHVSCLNKYKIKWATITNEMIEIDGLEREMEESLICPECYPLCSDAKYRVTTSRLRLVPSRRRGFGLINDIKNVSDISVIRVYFGQKETWQYKQDVSFYWFEIFGNIGGLCGVVGGFSLIGFTEIFYFFIKQFLLYIAKKLKIRVRSRQLDIYP